MVMIQNILDRKGGEVITIRATETVKSAADRMREHGIAALAVANEEGDLHESSIPFAFRQRHLCDLLRL